METVARVDSFLPIPCFPEREESHTLPPGTKDLQLSSSPEAATPTPRTLDRLLLRQPPSTRDSAVPALQSKIKALSERNKAAGREAILFGLNKNASPVASSLFSPVLVSWSSSSSDDDAESQDYTVRPVLPETPVEGAGVSGLDFSLLALPQEQGEGSSLENLYIPLEDDFTGERADEPWAPPKGFWEASSPETMLLNGYAPSPPDTPRAGASGGQQRTARGYGGAGRVIQCRDSLEGLRRCINEQGPRKGQCGADSLDSMCSSGVFISLAERVEMNRGLLKQLLNRSQGPKPGAKAEEVSQCNGRGFVSLNESDWDSGISLQDSEHSQSVCDSVCDSVCAAARVFVCSEDVQLSPRHEQAKQLLERACMKARSFPLKADHTILPVQRDGSEQLSTAGASFHRAPLAGKDSASVSSAVVPAITSLSGNLSDSSSGDSACGHRRRPGQSPTRVRFEDESEKEAEVRYLERLRQRRRAAERAQGLLISKPSLSSYVNGRRDTGPGSGTVAEQDRCPESSTSGNQRDLSHHEGYLNCGSGVCLDAIATQEALNMQSISSGFFLEGGNPDLHLNHWPWVAPSKPSRTVHTELIKETYIGKMTPGNVDDGTMSSMAGQTDSTGGVQVSRMKVRRTGRRGEVLSTNGHGGPYTMPSPPPQRPNGSVAPVSSSNSNIAPVSSSNSNIAPVSSSNSNIAPVSSSNGNAAPVNFYNGFVVVPPNPYAIVQEVSNVVGLPVPSLAPHAKKKHSPPRSYPLSPLPSKSDLKSTAASRRNGQHSDKLMPSPQFRLSPKDSRKDQGRGVAQSPQITLSGGVAFEEVFEEGPCLGLNPNTGTVMPCVRPASLLNTSRLPAGTAAERNPASEAQVEEPHPGIEELSLERASVISLPTYHSMGDGRGKGPMRAEHLRDGSPSPTQRLGKEEGQREGKPKHSLRSFFSAFGLNRVGRLGQGRSSSMEQLSVESHTVPMDLSCPNSNSSPSPAHPETSRLRKAPSLQSLRMGSPFMQLRKSSSVQNLQSAKKGDRSGAYKPGDQPCSPAVSRGIQRTLSVEDVGGPSGMRSVGRVAQAFPDGTLLLELSRPANGSFGFIISRGKGRPDSGVYVEEMCDRSTEKLYAGLLGVGDELLEVNGEKVSGLSLDLVTDHMSRHSVASVRVLRHRKLPAPR
ncbi:hypothetical protein UPYG_G00037400 [Umbra pygmaea]|uniref:PDZ domain-containing protein n=1 Tax=Umbra pygmaea TaxID=75934 RepID=A0ABD0XP82_UMBPY